MEALIGKLRPPSTVFFVCDIQERFRDLIWNMPSVIHTAKFMMNVSKELEVPCVVTEQYPKVIPLTASSLQLPWIRQALLHTVKELNIGPDIGQHQAAVFPKKRFSMCTEEVLAHVKQMDPVPQDVVLFGIEAHVCIAQTCLDLIEKGFKVHLVCDGISSQKVYDRTVAIQRMLHAGAFLTTAEQVTFQLLESAEHPRFKAVSALVRERAQEGNAFSDMAAL